MAEIIFSDEFAQEVGSLIRTEAIELNKAINAYITILIMIKENGIIEGSTANALEAFISEVETLKGQYELLGQSANLYCGNCVSKIDEADEYLY